jgi:hypothetical protein
MMNLCHKLPKKRPREPLFHLDLVPLEATSTSTISVLAAVVIVKALLSYLSKIKNLAMSRKKTLFLGKILMPLLA